MFNRKATPALVLPILTNFVPLFDGKPAEGAKTETFTGKGDNWFWVLRRDRAACERRSCRSRTKAS